MAEILRKKLEVSIVIINYNNLKLLNSCIDSILVNSNSFDYEIIVVDNSTNQEDVKSLENKSELIKVIKNTENVGYAAACNQGIRVSNGEFLIILNNDVIFFDNAIKNVLDYAKNNDINAFYGCKLLNGDKTFQKECVYDLPTVRNLIASYSFAYLFLKKNKKYYRYNYSEVNEKNAHQVGGVIGAFIFGRKKLFEKLNGFDEKFYFYAEEIDLFIRASKISTKVYYLPFVSIIHLGGATTGSTTWFKYKRQTIAYIQTYQKSFKGVSFFLIMLFHYLGTLIRIPIFMITGVILFNLELIKRSCFHFLQLFVYPKNLFK